MSSYISYSIKFPQTPVLFETGDILTFSINHIKSRHPSIVEFRLHCYDMSDEEIAVYTSPRLVITTEYTHQEHEFNVESNIRDNTVYTMVEMITYGIDNDNPLYFSEIMLNEGSYDGYHTPSEEVTSARIDFMNNSYVNLYDRDANYLQVIRPNKESFNTDVLNGAEVTILAPHFDDDNSFDDDVSVFIEALNQTNQTINVLR